MPLSVDRTCHVKAPAKRFVPETARAKTKVLVKPELTSVQFMPLLVDRNTPATEVPVKRFVSETARA